jgi:MFS family permease
MLSAFSLRDYRLLWIGQTVALLGDQFHLIAMPWLVLQMTGDPVQLGLVLAVAGVSRASFMLLGGAMADRFAPRDIMIWTNVLRFGVAAALAVAVLSGNIQMWMVYLAALIFGVITGIFEPASQAAVPRLVPDEQLESGNSLVFFGDQLANFLGPAAAGALIGWFGSRAVEGSAAAASLTGVGVAFAVHAASFALSIAFLAAMGRMAPVSGGVKEHEHPLRSIANGFRYVVSRSELVWVLVLMAAANLFTMGPLLVGVPVLADTRLPEGPAALGMVLSGFAFGNLAGVVAAGTMKRPSPRVLGATVIALFVTFGVGLGSFAVVQSTWIAVPVMAFIGIGNGFLGVTIVTYLQRVTPKEMIGRMMSLMMMGIFAMMPVSQALSGFIVALSIEVLFVAAGVGLVLTALVAASRPEVRSFGAPRQPATESANVAASLG